MQRADEAEVASVGFPAISTGAFGYPEDEAAEAMVARFEEVLPELAEVEHVRVVLWGEDALDVHRGIVERRLADG